MKKLFFVAVIGALVACGESATTEQTVDTTTVAPAPVDTTAAAVDTAAAAVDTAAAKVDTAAKK